MTDHRLAHPPPTIQPHTTIQLGDVVIDLDDYRIIAADGTITPLTGQEQLLLLTLIEAGGQVLSKEALGRLAWGYSCGYSANAIWNCVHTVRRKLGDDARQPRYIQTVHRIGYRIRLQEPSSPTGERPAEPASHWT